METATLEYITPKANDIDFQICKPNLVQIKKKTATIYMVLQS